MELPYIVPQPSTFYLRLPDKTFVMEPISLRHELNFVAKFGEDWASEILGNGDIEQIAFIIYRLLDDDSKKLLTKREVETCDDDGNDITVKLGGVALLISFISGKQEVEQFMASLFDNIGISRAVVDEKDVKKKVVN